MTGTQQASADGASKGAGQQYYLVFPGNILPGSNYQQSITYLADLLKTSLYKAKKLVSGKKRYIKRKFPRSQAETLREQVLALGVACELKAAKEKDLSVLPALQPANPGQTEVLVMPQSVVEEGEPAEQAGVDKDPAVVKSYSQTMNELQAIADGLRKKKPRK